MSEFPIRAAHDINPVASTDRLSSQVRPSCLDRGMEPTSLLRWESQPAPLAPDSTLLLLLSEMIMTAGPHRGPRVIVPLIGSL